MRSWFFRMALWCTLLAGLCLPSVAFCQTTAPAADGLPVEVTPAPAVNFVPLYNGQDLSGLEIVNGPPDAFVARDKELVSSGAARYPTLLRSLGTYENFILRLEYKGPKHSQFALLLHAPEHGRGSRVGIGIQLGDDVAAGSRAMPSGSIHGLINAPFVATRHFNEWNSVAVLMDWPRLAVWINDKKVQDLNCEDHHALRYRARQGRIGFQTLETPFVVRNLYIAELPSKEQGRWISLFNGRDLTGWHIEGKAKWEVHEGAIRPSPPIPGYLVSDQEFQDFELQLYARTGRLTNSGIFFRWKSLASADRGYEVQILNNPDSNNPTGSIYGYSRANVLTATDGDWFPIQLIVQGSRAVVRVNGEFSTIAEHLTMVRPGSIALQMHDAAPPIEFKDIRIRPLLTSETLEFHDEE